MMKTTPLGGTNLSRQNKEKGEKRNRNLENVNVENTILYLPKAFQVLANFAANKKANSGSV